MSDYNIELSLDVMKLVKNMDFGSALTFLKDGYFVRRAYWKKDCYIVLDKNTFVFIDKEIDTREHWCIEDCHLIAEDWEFYIDHLLDVSNTI